MKFGVDFSSWKPKYVLALVLGSGALIAGLLYSGAVTTADIAWLVRQVTGE